MPTPPIGVGSALAVDRTPVTITIVAPLPITCSQCGLLLVTCHFDTANTYVDGTLTCHTHVDHVWLAEHAKKHEKGWA